MKNYKISVIEETDPMIFIVGRYLNFINLGKTHLALVSDDNFKYYLISFDNAPDVIKFCVKNKCLIDAFFNSPELNLI